MVPQIVLISGCSSGIGLSTAVLLAKDPEKRFKVFATMRNLAKKGQLEEEGKECLGDTLIIKQMDVCSDESVNKAVQEVISEEGRIDVLFNNAGIGTLPCPVECISTQLAKDLFDVNYFGTLRLIKAVLPSMKSKESGHIINNSSHFGVVAYPFFEVYASTKFAVEGLSESLAPTLRQFNIRCTLLEPGPVITSSAGSAAELTKGADLSKADKKSLQLMDSFQERMGQVLGHEDGLVSSDKIADLVKEIILTEKPNVRYQTHKKFGADEIQAKLADPTGNKSVDIIVKRFCEEK